MSSESRTFGRHFAMSACAAVVAMAGAMEEAGAVQQIERYCAKSWRNARILEQDWDDCTQQAFTELLERIGEDGFDTALQSPQSDERRELNRSIWCVIQRWRRAPKPTMLGEIDPPARNSYCDPQAADEVQEMLDRCSLSDRQRKILSAWSQGQKIADIAAELDISPARVSDEKYKAVQAIRKSLHLQA